MATTTVRPRAALLALRIRSTLAALEDLQSAASIADLDEDTLLLLERELSPYERLDLDLSSDASVREAARRLGASDARSLTLALPSAHPAQVARALLDEVSVRPTHRAQYELGLWSQLSLDAHGHTAVQAAYDVPAPALDEQIRGLETTLGARDPEISRDGAEYAALAERRRLRAQEAWYRKVDALLQQGIAPRPAIERVYEQSLSADSPTRARPRVAIERWGTEIVAELEAHGVRRVAVHALAAPFTGPVSPEHGTRAPSTMKERLDATIAQATASRPPPASTRPDRTR